MKGKIIKGIGGFYYVHTGKEIYSCKAAGIFRKLKIKPLPGDDVEFMPTDENDKEGNITEIFGRKNVLSRPAVANVDQVLAVFALKDPDPSTFYMDSLLVSLDALDIDTVVFFNKCDLDKQGSAQHYKQIYERAGYPVVTGSALNDETLDTLKTCLDGKTTALAGPSGVGKSTLSNRLAGEGRMEVGDISIRNKRGRQTTRHTELIYVAADTFIMDTPGFSSLDISGIRSCDLKDYFGEFAPYEAGCRFRSCRHADEGSDVCAVKRAVDGGEIARSRYLSYRRLFNEIKEREFL